MDGPENGNAVAGYATGIYNNKGMIMAAWMVSKGDSLPDPAQVVYSEISDYVVPYTLTPSEFGTPSSPLSLDSKGLAFGCFNRLCAASFSSRIINLANGNTNFTKVGQIITIGKVRFIAASSNKRIVLVKI